MAIKVGEKAPDFAAKKADGKEVSNFRLAEEIGKDNLVLAFFPAAFTGVCTKEMCTFRDEIAEYGKLGARVFGISVDMPFSLNKFHQENTLSFPLLSDFNKEAITRFGVAYEDFLGLKGVAKRSVFVIDRKGVVRYVWTTDVAKDFPPLADVRKAIGGLKG